ncbi:WGR domain-containing protein [Sulfurimonas sp.]|uniref:WGR domain-containing protein n=1 Tax=Sulfurimonas sp. TaxID=2022749 RepID=UPI0025E6E225|nr:WGR domain-containing protein [Sulfurimonas sp.]MBW6487523.1 WGR domain-containing protein [Sulfurimonas sp.]
MRYYSIKIRPTLFGDFTLTREYGSIRNSKPTGKIDEYFDALDVAVLRLKKLVELKFKKGYWDDI